MRARASYTLASLETDQMSPPFVRSSCPTVVVPSMSSPFPRGMGHGRGAPGEGRPDRTCVLAGDTGRRRFGTRPRAWLAAGIASLGLGHPRLGRHRAGLQLLFAGHDQHHAGEDQIRIVDQVGVRRQDVGPAVAVPIEERRDAGQRVAGLHGVDSASAGEARDDVLRLVQLRTDPGELIALGLGDELQALLLREHLRQAPGELAGALLGVLERRRRLAQLAACRLGYGLDGRQPGLERLALGQDRLERIRQGVPLGRERVALGAQQVPLRLERAELRRELVPLGRERVPFRRERVPLRRERFPLGFDAVALGSDARTLGRQLLDLLSRGVALGDDLVQPVLDLAQPCARAFELGGPRGEVGFHAGQRLLDRRQVGSRLCELDIGHREVGRDLLARGLGRGELLGDALYALRSLGGSCFGLLACVLRPRQAGFEPRRHLLRCAQLLTERRHVGHDLVALGTNLAQRALDVLPIRSHRRQTILDCGRLGLDRREVLLGHRQLLAQRRRVGGGRVPLGADLAQRALDALALRLDGRQTILEHRHLLLCRNEVGLRRRQLLAHRAQVVQRDVALRPHHGQLLRRAGPLGLDLRQAILHPRRRLPYRRQLLTKRRHGRRSRVSLGTSLAQRALDALPGSFRTREAIFERGHLLLCRNEVGLRRRQLLAHRAQVVQRDVALRPHHGQLLRRACPLGLDLRQAILHPRCRLPYRRQLLTKRRHGRRSRVSLGTSLAQRALDALPGSFRTRETIFERGHLLLCRNEVGLRRRQLLAHRAQVVQRDVALRPHHGQLLRRACPLGLDLRQAILHPRCRLPYRRQLLTKRRHGRRSRVSLGTSLAQRALDALPGSFRTRETIFERGHLLLCRNEVGLRRRPLLAHRAQVVQRDVALRPHHGQLLRRAGPLGLDLRQAILHPRRRLPYRRQLLTKRRHGRRSRVSLGTSLAQRALDALPGSFRTRETIFERGHLLLCRNEVGLRRRQLLAHRAQVVQ